MSKLDEKEEIALRLQNEFGYGRPGSTKVAEIIATLHEQIAESFAIWWESGLVPEIEVEGYSVTRLQTEHNMNPIAAFLTLNSLLRNPDKILPSLRKGHDQIGPSRE